MITGTSQVRIRTSIPILILVKLKQWNIVIFI
jgi:hypothetical protein